MTAFFVSFKLALWTTAILIPVGLIVGRWLAYSSIGLSPLRTWWHIELPLTWQGILASATLVFAHTLGEFGVVLMVGGNIDGATRTVSIAIYDSVQSFDMKSAGWYSIALVAVSLVALAVVRTMPVNKTQVRIKALKKARKP